MERSQEMVIAFTMIALSVVMFVAGWATSSKINWDRNIGNSSPAGVVEAAPQKQLDGPPTFGHPMSPITEIKSRLPPCRDGYMWEYEVRSDAGYLRLHLRILKPTELSADGTYHDASEGLMTVAAERTYSLETYTETQHNERRNEHGVWQNVGDPVKTSRRFDEFYKSIPKDRQRQIGVMNKCIVDPAVKWGTEQRNKLCGGQEFYDVG